MKLPDKYSWLLNEHAPKMIVEGLNLLQQDTQEIYGDRDNPIIMGLAKEMRVDNIYHHDETAWCALAQFVICKRAGKPIHKEGWDLLRARSFETWGNPVSTGNIMLGDILVFARVGGGHVGMYVAESEHTFHVMGGNQGNRYSIVEISKDRLSAARRYYSIAPPPNVRKIFMGSHGIVSHNEA